jgi:hypothetical protein
MTTLAPEAGRRRRIVVAAQGVAFESGGVLEQWAELERNLDEYLDARFVSDQYARELHAAQSRELTTPQREADPPDRLAAWRESIDDPAVEALDLQLLLDLARLEEEPTRVLAIMELLRSQIADAAAADRFDEAAAVCEAIRVAAADADHAARRSAAADVLARLSGSPAAERALAIVSDPSAEPPASVTRLVDALGAGLLPSLVRHWAAASDQTVRARLQQHLIESGDAGRRILRRLAATSKERPDTRLAALRLLRAHAGSDLTATFEECLADADAEIRAEAFDALAGTANDRERDALAAGIANAPPDGQAALIDRVAAMPREASVPILARLVRAVDQGTVAPGALRTIIGGLADAGTDEAARALLQVFAHTSWRSPHRALQYRMAAAAGLRRIGGPWSAAGWRALAGVGGSPGPDDDRTAHR